MLRKGVGMVRNQILSRIGLITFDPLPQKQLLPVDTNMVPDPSSSVTKRFLSGLRKISPKVEFWAEEGVVEIQDPRLFRPGPELFCLALVEAAVGPGLAERVEIRLGTATCRLEFEPARYSRDELAAKVASALKAAALTTRVSSTATVARESIEWITLSATASASGPSIRETLIDDHGQVAQQPRLATSDRKISAYSKRPIRPFPRKTRSNRPKARPAILARTRQLVEPIALALSSTSIFPAGSMALTVPSGSDSKRMIHLALAGGSFAMATAGVILPGIPALPFLLLTGHYLVKSSPEFCLRLENVPGLGALIQRATEVGGQVIDRRSLLKMLGFTVAALTAFAIFHPPLPIVILLELGVMVYYGFRAVRKPSTTALRSNFGPRMAALT